MSNFHQEATEQNYSMSKLRRKATSLDYLGG